MEFFMYRVFIDIAGKSAMAGLCTYWFRSVCISSAITAKSSKIQILRIALDRFAVNGPLAAQSMISSRFQPPGAHSVAIAVRKVHFHSVASFVQICMYRLMRTSPCVQTHRYSLVCADPHVQIRRYRFVCTDPRVHIRRYRFVSTDPRVQMHRCKSRVQIRKYRSIGTDPMQIHLSLGLYLGRVSCGL